MFKIYAPDEARTHNLGIASPVLLYKYRALTDCATGALNENVSDELCGFHPGCLVSSDPKNRGLVKVLTLSAIFSLTFLVSNILDSF